jgi:hypothetical protein
MKHLIAFTLGLFLLPSIALAQLSILKPSQGGTGLGSVTVGDIGKCLKVLASSPFSFELDTCGTGGGGGGSSLFEYDGGTDTISPIIASTSNTAKISASTFVATSTSATSTLPWLDITQRLRMASDYFTDLTGYGLKASGTTLAVDNAVIAEVSDLHNAVTLSGALDYITLVGQDIVRGAIDLATDITGTLGVSNGGTGLTSTSTFLFENEIDTESELETFLTDVTNVFTNNDGTLADDNLTNNSIEDLNDVAAMTENTGDLLSWNGSTWTDVATSTLGFLTSAITSFNGLTGSSQTLATTSSAGGWGFGSSGSVHTLNIPTAGASTVLGLLSATDWGTFNAKQNALTAGYQIGLSGAVISSTALGTTSIDTLAKIESITGVSNILIENDIDASSELRALMDDETGTGAAMFGITSSMSDDISCSASQVLARNSGDSAWECVAQSSGGGGGGMSTSTDNNPEVGETISYINTDFYVGGSASNTAELNFDKDNSKLTISAPTNDGAFIGIATTSSSTVGTRGLVVQGNIFAAGNATATNLTATGTTWINALRDSTGSLGSSGMLLQSNGSVATWVATGTLGFSGSGGITSLGGQTGATQTFATTSAVGGFGFSSSANTHTLNIPTASAGTALGLLSASDWSTFNSKQATISAGYQIGLSGTTLSSTALGTTSIDSIAKVESILGGTNVIVSTEIDSVSEIETLAGAVNILLETEIDASSELAAIMDDETGTAGALVFSNSPTLTGTTLFTNASGTAATTTRSTTTNLAVSGSLGLFGSAPVTSNNALCIQLTGTADLCDGSDASGGGGGGGSFPFSADTNFGQVVYSTSTPTLWFKSGVYASSTSEFDAIDVAGNISALEVGATPIIAAYASNGTDYVQMYSSGGYGQLEASNAFVLTAPSGVTVVGTANPQLRVQYGGGSYNSLTVYHNDTDATIANSNTAGDIIFQPGTASGNVGIATTSPESRLDVWGLSGGKILTLFSNAGTKLMEVTNAGVATLLGYWDFGGASLELPNSTSLPGTCTVGQIYMDTDATSGQRIYACQSANTWALQGDGGGGGGSPGGSDTQVQFNDGGAFGGAVGFVWNKTLSLLGIGSTTPHATVAIQSSTTTIPVFAIATTTGERSDLFSISATGTLWNANRYKDTGVRAVIGNYMNGAGFYQQPIYNLTNYGTQKQEGWATVDCPAIGMAGIAVVADGVFTPCGALTYAEDGTGPTTAVGVALNDGGMYTNFSASTAANDGGGLFIGNLSWMKPATNTPIIDVTLSVGAGATSTSYFIGYTSTNPGGTTFEVQPTAGCFLTASTTRANWILVSRTSASAHTETDTGIASSTVLNAATGAYRRFIVMNDATSCTAYIQPTWNDPIRMVARHTTNISTTTTLSFGVYGMRSTASVGSTAASFRITDFFASWRRYPLVQ